MKKKYLINSFLFQKSLFEKHLGDTFDFDFIPPFVHKPMRGASYSVLNFFYTLYMTVIGRIGIYDVVHINRPEAVLLYKPSKEQISIFEVHGFDVSILVNNYLKDLKSPIKIFLENIIDRLISPIVKRKVREVDLFYCSTPDLVLPLTEWSGRKPLWLPNPIDLEQFSDSIIPTKLEGSPACFLAARLHGDKKPEVAIDIFVNTIKPKYPNATLHLIAFGELVEHYKSSLLDPQTYFWHKYMDKETLASVIKGADLVFGDFSIGALSLLPMQVMAMKRAIVTLDKYEIIKKDIEDLPKMALQLLTDIQYCNEVVERNYQYIVSVHSPEAVCRRHADNMATIKPF